MYWRSCSLVKGPALATLGPEGNVPSALARRLLSKPPRNASLIELLVMLGAAAAPPREPSLFAAAISSAFGLLSGAGIRTPVASSTAFPVCSSTGLIILFIVSKPLPKIFLPVSSTFIKLELTDSSDLFIAAVTSGVVSNAFNLAKFFSLAFAFAKPTAAPITGPPTAVTITIASFPNILFCLFSSSKIIPADTFVMSSRE